MGSQKSNQEMEQIIHDIEVFGKLETGLRALCKRIRDWEKMVGMEGIPTLDETEEVIVADTLFQMCLLIEKVKKLKETKDGSSRDQEHGR